MDGFIANAPVSVVMASMILTARNGGKPRNGDILTLHVSNSTAN